ncbi:YciI family protein [Bergeriella denitrificans]|uniref:YCII-related domain n=1 Tax=Bergeriella denitrificans TaxID=494 RepID=A0A378UDP6_BERDE|nr:YciI family protein [Bergeriella denitrificans]STZ75427.1 YCII-related domain [Bergeriella denitrificans]
MYLIDIVLDQANIPADQADEMLTTHRDWFGKYARSGHFLIVGPYRDQAHAGIVVAQAENRAALDAILAEDVYFADRLARYTVREFQANLVAEHIEQFKGQ